MREKLLKVLACPKCSGDLSCEASEEEAGEIKEGRLECAGCGEVYPVTAGIPRFVEPNNYADEPSLTRKRRYEWAVLDTFDMLSPQYDLPQTQGDVERALAAEGITEITRPPNWGLNLVGRKGSAGDAGREVTSARAGES